MRLSELSYYQTGGTCAELHQPESLAELQALRADIHRRRIPFFLLGAGTNSLVLDEPFPGAVIAFTRLLQTRVDGDYIYAEAGVENTALAELALRNSRAGLAWMNRLPGQLGATVRMNARCYGGEISQVVEAVTAVTATGEIREYHDSSVFRGYKDTLFMHNGDIVAAARLKVQAGVKAEIQKQMDHCANDRIAKGQFLYPSCGCVFKNDYNAGVPSGALLDAAGAKTMGRGAAMINPQHANFLFNTGGATSREIIEISLNMRAAVYQKFGVWLEYEMEVLGALPADLAQALSEQRPQQFKEEELAPLRQRFQAARA